MYSAKSYELKESEFNYLLSPLVHLVSYQNGKYYFIDRGNDLDDMLNRLKGLYNYYDELGSMIVYKCSFNGNLNEFRNFLNK